MQCYPGRYGARCTAQLAIRKAKLLRSDTCREMEDILIGEGDDWPTDYYHGFDQPMAVIIAASCSRLRKLVGQHRLQSDFDCQREANFPIRKRAGVIGEK